jgi:hypothetical protein
MEDSTALSTTLFFESASSALDIAHSLFNLFNLFSENQTSSPPDTSSSPSSSSSSSSGEQESERKQGLEEHEGDAETKQFEALGESAKGKFYIFHLLVILTPFTLF